MCEELQNIASTMTLPWVVVGNFNIVLFENENSSGVPVNNQAST